VLSSNHITYSVVPLAETNGLAGERISTTHSSLQLVGGSQHLDQLRPTHSRSPWTRDNIYLHLWCLSLLCYRLHAPSRLNLSRSIRAPCFCVHWRGRQSRIPPSPAQFVNVVVGMSSNSEFLWPFGPCHDKYPLINDFAERWSVGRRGSLTAFARHVPLVVTMLILVSEKSNSVWHFSAGLAFE